MNGRQLRVLLTLNALVGGGFGLLLLFLPGPLLRLLGFHIGPDGELLARLYGAELLGFNLATWMARSETAGRSLQRAIVAGHVVNEGLSFLAMASGVASGAGNALAWSTAGLTLAFAVAFVAALPRILRNDEGQPRSLQQAFPFFKRG